MPDTITLVHAYKTTQSPAQWNTWDVNGQYWYLRFCDGHGTISRDYDLDNAASSFDDKILADVSFSIMIDRLGIVWSPDSAVPGTEYQDVP